MGMVGRPHPGLQVRACDAAAPDQIGVEQLALCVPDEEGITGICCGTPCDAK